MRKPDIYQIVIFLLIIAIIITLGVFIFNLTKGQLGKSALSIDVVYDKAAVLINGKEKGETPVYTEEVFTKQTQVDINGKTNTYTTSIKPAGGTLAVIKRDLGVSDTFSSGQNIWFEKVGGDEALVSVITPETEEVSVIVDGVEMGKTPVKFPSKDLLTQSPEDKYTLTFSKEGYEEQEVEIKVRPGYQLNIKADMFLKPIPSSITTIEGMPEGVVMINFSDVSNAGFVDKKEWAAAINYWLSTRGAATLGNNKVMKFGYFVDDAGKVYNESGNEIAPQDVKLEVGMYLAYLGSQQNSDLTEDAKSTVGVITGSSVESDSTTDQATEKTANTGKKIKVSPNSLGFLRVRGGPSTGEAEVGKVNVGDTFDVKGEQNGWYKIEYVAGKEGWVSGDYVSIVTD